MLLTNHIITVALFLLLFCLNTNIFCDETNSYKSFLHQVWLKGQEEFKANNYKDAIAIWKKGLEFAQDLKDKSGILIFQNHIGIAYGDQKKYKQAIKFFKQAMKNCNVNEDCYNRIPIVLNNLGATYINLGQNKIALRYYLEALPISRKINNINLEKDVLNEIASIYSEQKEYRKLIECFMQLLEIYRKMKDVNNEASILHHIGIAYSNIAESNKAINYFKLSIEINRSNKKLYNLQGNYLDLGLLYEKISHYKQALVYYKKALHINKKIKNKHDEAYALYLISGILNEMGKYKEALENLQKSLSINREFNNNTFRKK